MSSDDDGLERWMTSVGRHVGRTWPLARTTTASGRRTRDRRPILSPSPSDDFYDGELREESDATIIIIIIIITIIIIIIIVTSS